MGVTKKPIVRRRTHASKSGKAYKMPHVKLKTLRTTEDYSVAFRVEKQVINAFRKRGQAVNNGDPGKKNGAGGGYLLSNWLRTR